MSQRAKPVSVLDPSHTAVVIVGCGGTGSHLLSGLCRLLYSIKQAPAVRSADRVSETEALAGAAVPHSPPPVTVVEGAAVSSRNVLRQGYLPPEVGSNKALALCERYGAAYGLELAAYPQYLNADTDLGRLVPEGAVVVGCLDNAASRAMLHQGLCSYEHVVYLDAGNAGVPAAAPDAAREGRPDREQRIALRESGWEGQVVCGARVRGEQVLPFAGHTFPELLEIENEDDLHPQQVPCERAAAAAPQRMMTNLLATDVLLSYLTTLLTEGTVLNQRTAFDARQGYLRSTPAIEEMEEFIA